MMLKAAAKHPPSRKTGIRIGVFSFFLALPWLFPQWVFCSNPSPWLEFLYGYRIIDLAAIVAASIVSLCMFVEKDWRSRNGLLSFPALSCAAGFFMATFFIPGHLLPPLLSHFPGVCRVSRSAEWETPGGTFFLVLKGRGTEADHEFTNGYLNYSGNVVAGFTGIRFHPIQFQNDYYEKYEVGSEALLEGRLGKTGLQGNELKELSDEIWEVLNSDRRENELQITLGKLDALKCGVDQSVRWMAGGIVWSVLLLVAFQVVGRLSAQYKIVNSVP